MGAGNRLHNKYHSDTASRHVTPEDSPGPTQRGWWCGQVKSNSPQPVLVPAF